MSEWVKRIIFGVVCAAITAAIFVGIDYTSVNDVDKEKAELINAIVAKSEMSKKDADVALSAVIDSIKDALKAGEKVQIVGFGTFSVKKRAPRTGKNPKTGETIQIAASKVPAFAAGKALKDEIQ